MQGLISVQKVSTKESNMLKTHILPVLSISFTDEEHSRVAPGPPLVPVCLLKAPAIRDLPQNSSCLGLMSLNGAPESQLLAGRRKWMFCLSTAHCFCGAGDTCRDTQSNLVQMHLSVPMGEVTGTRR